MKILKNGLKTVFAVSLIIGLVGCVGEEKKFSFEDSCPNGELVILSPSGSNEHGMEVSICEYSDHVVIQQPGTYKVAFGHITTVPCTEKQQKSGIFFEDGERAHYVGCEGWTITTTREPYKGSMSHGARLTVFKPKDNVVITRGD